MCTQKQRESVILGPWGGNGGSEWDDGVFSTIKTIFVSRGEREIRSIQIEYCGKNGESIVSERHGWVVADTLDKIELDYPDEYLMRITGFHAFEQYAYKHFEDQAGGLHLLRSLCFFTNKKKYGPFGNERGTYFTSGKDGKVVGFHGRCGAFLDGIGVHMEY
ncbi:hypothetical protein IFM89_001670 [Coptis chinensis]|uniref:Jacalin-type lectin domain-containing protein n=1 Tax=Coptis chinensis TaxID=261450 RepID=A0A835LQD3_9MAGN|nr:hypothetical protein IFM89_001670 [Coptis chinensis]